MTSSQQGDVGCIGMECVCVCGGGIWDALHSKSVAAPAFLQLAVDTNPIDLLKAGNPPCFAPGAVSSSAELLL